MASGSRHSATPDDFYRVARAYARALKPCNIPAEYYAPRVRRSLAYRMVHQLLRVAARLIREERGELRPVPSERRSSPVGELVSPHPLLVICGTGRVPDLTRWRQLVALDNTQPLRRVTER